MTDHEFDATTARLAEIRARADAATEGPWVRGDRKRIAGVTGRFGEDRCVYCKEGTEPSWVGVRDINGTEMLAHVHAASAFTWWDHGIYATRAAATDSICVVRDTDEYGLMDPADAEFIAAARQDVPWLLAEVERLTGERDRARGLAARLEEQVARVEALAVAVDNRMMATAKPAEIWAALRGEGACEGSPLCPGDTRTEAVCRHCGRTIRVYWSLNAWRWWHDDDGHVLLRGPYEYCRVTTATPTGEDRP